MTHFIDDRNSLVILSVKITKITNLVGYYPFTPMWGIRLIRCISDINGWLIVKIQITNWFFYGISTRYLWAHINAWSPGWKNMAGAPLLDFLFPFSVLQKKWNVSISLSHRNFCLLFDKFCWLYFPFCELYIFRFPFCNKLGRYSSLGFFPFSFLRILHFPFSVLQQTEKVFQFRSFSVFRFPFCKKTSEVFQFRIFPFSVLKIIIFRFPFCNKL